ncbi:hypothetical protein ASD83_12310 [Devosia sp. Root685]|nr:hypothetical protein ASD83_12310 [Devosia sp. Root685]
MHYFSFAEIYFIQGSAEVVASEVGAVGREESRGLTLAHSGVSFPRKRESLFSEEIAAYAG